MFDIRSIIVPRYDQIFQTYLTITSDDRRQAVLAFHKHEIGPTSSAATAIENVAFTLVSVMRHARKRRPVDRGDLV